MGRVSAFAIGATGERTWKSAAIIGRVPTWAAQVTANGSRRTCGRKATWRAMAGVSRMNRRGAGERQLKTNVPSQLWVPAEHGRRGHRERGPDVRWAAEV